MKTGEKVRHLLIYSLSTGRIICYYLSSKFYTKICASLNFHFFYFRFILANRGIQRSFLDSKCGFLWLKTSHEKRSRTYEKICKRDKIEQFLQKFNQIPFELFEGLLLTAGKGKFCSA